MNSFLKDQFVRRYFSIGGGGGGGDGGAGAAAQREREVTARMNQYVTDTRGDADNLINQVRSLYSNVVNRANTLSDSYLKDLDTEERQLLDRIKGANTWLTSETDRNTADLSKKIGGLLTDLDTAAQKLNLGQRGEVSSLISDYKAENRRLDDKLTGDTAGALFRMDQGTNAAIDEFADMTPAKLSIFTNAADFISKRAQQTRMDLLAAADPRALELSAIADENAAAMMSGRISADTQANLARTSAMRALQGGFGASSQMGRGLAARDLGLTALDLQQQGLANSNAQRQLNYQTRVAGLQTDAVPLFSDTRNTVLASRLAAVDTRRAQELGLADRLYGTQVARSQNLLGTNIGQTNLFYDQERARENQKFTTGTGLAGRIFDVNLARANTIYGTDVNAAGNLYSTGVNAAGNVFGTKLQAEANRATAIDRAETNKLAAMTGVRSQAAAQIENAAEATYQARMQQAASQNAGLGSIIGAGASVLGAVVGNAVAPGIGGMIGGTLGGMAGQFGASQLGYGGGYGGAQGVNLGMTAMGALSSSLGGRPASFYSQNAATAAAPYAGSFSYQGNPLIGGMGWVPRATAA